jgi:ferredoxin
LKPCGTSRKVAASVPKIATKILHSLKPGVDSDACKNEYQQYFLVGESDRCIGLTNLPLSCAVCHEICELNLLETSGTQRPTEGFLLFFLNEWFL